MCQRCVFAHLFYKANIVIFLKNTNYLLHIFAVILIWNPAYNPMIKSSRILNGFGSFLSLDLFIRSSERRHPTTDVLPAHRGHPMPGYR